LSQSRPQISGRLPLFCILSAPGGPGEINTHTFSIGLVFFLLPLLVGTPGRIRSAFSARGRRSGGYTNDKGGTYACMMCACDRSSIKIVDTVCKLQVTKRARQRFQRHWILFLSEFLSLPFRPRGGLIASERRGGVFGCLSSNHREISRLLAYASRVWPRESQRRLLKGNLAFSKFNGCERQSRDVATPRESSDDTETLARVLCHCYVLLLNTSKMQRKRTRLRGVSLLSF